MKRWTIICNPVRSVSNRRTPPPPPGSCRKTSLRIISPDCETPRFSGQILRLRPDRSNLSPVIFPEFCTTLSENTLQISPCDTFSGYFRINSVSGRDRIDSLRIRGVPAQNSPGQSNSNLDLQRCFRPTDDEFVALASRPAGVWTSRSTLAHFKKSAPGRQGHAAGIYGPDSGCESAPPLAQRRGTGKLVAWRRSSAGRRVRSELARFVWAGKFRLSCSR